jgi:rhodanese-related sulfurtransferase
VPEWAPIERSYAGLPELPPGWLAAHRDDVTLLDVRSAEEYDGPEGHVSGALLIPLPELQDRIAEVPGDAPTVVVCHSGRRSALATQQLIKAGREQVANLRGGMVAWRRAGLPVEGPVAGAA